MQVFNDIKNQIGDTSEDLAASRSSLDAFKKQMRLRLQLPSNFVQTDNQL